MLDAIRVPGENPRAIVALEAQRSRSRRVLGVVLFLVLSERFDAIKPGTALLAGELARVYNNMLR